jgi:hypothetical protein
LWLPIIVIVTSDAADNRHYRIKLLIIGALSFQEAVSTMEYLQQRVVGSGASADSE